jgi:phosphoglycolate phosphatase-like HAD superfamily hydrolase
VLLPLFPIVIGDSPYDVEAAAKANIKTIGFISGGFEENVLDDAEAVKIYAGPTDLLNNYYKSPIETDY